MLLRSLHIASRQLFYLLVVLIILGLLGLMAAMWLSEEVAERKDEIAAWASDKTGYPVSIDQAGLYWFDLIPKLEVRGVSLNQKSGDTAIATVGAMYLSLDILQTLEQGEPVVADASIDQAKLALERSAAGKWHLTGLEKGKARRGETTVPEVIRWLSWFKQLELSDIQLAFSDQQQPALSGNYQLQQLQLEFAAGRWQATAEVNVPENLGKGFKFSASAGIDQQYQLIDWQGEVETEAFVLMPLINQLPLNGLQLSSGQVSGTVQASKKENGDIESEAALIVTGLTLETNKTGEVFEPVELDRLQGQFGFSKQAESWALKGDGLQIQMAGEPWPLTAFELQRNEQAEFSAKAEYLRLSDLTAIAMLMRDMPDWLIGSKPAGDIHDLQFAYQPHNGLQTVSLRAADLALLPWQDYPGANQLSFQLDWQNNQAEIKLDSHKTTVYADSWLDDAVFLESLTGTLSWRRQQNNWHLLADQLHLWNEDLNLSVNGRINHQNQQTDTDLRLELEDVRVNRWRDYVPASIIPDDFERWSRDAFREGVIRSGYVEMQGNPAAFPFDQEPGQGSFDMQLQVENTRLHYAEGWPDLTAVNGTISGQGNNLLIESQSGKIAGFAFNQVTTTISNLVRPKPVLRVDGLLNGTTPDALAFLQNSPLKKRFGQVTQWLQTKGRSDIQLALTVPLVDPDNTRAEGHVTFADSQLTTRAVPGLEISAINGKLNFNNNGVEAEAISAVAFNQAVSVDVVPQDGQTAVVINGQATVPALRTQWPDLIPAFVSGESDYQSRVAISEPEPGQFEVAVNVRSDLRGITVDTPAPLGKTASQRMPLDLAIENEGSLLYRLKLDNWLNAALRADNETLSGEVMLGGEAASTERAGLRVGGHLEQLNLDDWLDWQAQMSPADTGTAAMPDQIDLRIKQLQAARQNLDDIRITASPSPGQWQIGLDSSQIKGDINLPRQISSQRPVAVKLEHLRLNLADTDNTEADSRGDLWPALRLDIEALELDGMRLGQFNLRANRQPDSWQVESASLTSPVLQASLTGNWTRTAARDHSRFEIVASSDDLRALLAYYGYQEVIEARQVQINSQLDWTGDPSDFSLTRMQGKMDLTVGRGSLREVEPGAAGRIFGLLSITAIPRRLALDFSDLFGKGFDFSTISGKFEFANGIARTRNLVMQGDSALIEVAGPIDLVNKSYDQIVTVTPKVSSTLPLAGAVAGGPVGLGVGTAILLFDKLAGDIFDREIVNLISYRYQLTGPWENPGLNVVTSSTEQGQ